ncbi:MAG: hypothetical protein ACRCX2_02285, partial [Paraclostridium sp.]
MDNLLIGNSAIWMIFLALAFNMALFCLKSSFCCRYADDVAFAFCFLIIFAGLAYQGEESISKWAEVLL